MDQIEILRMADTDSPVAYVRADGELFAIKPAERVDTLLSSLKNASITDLSRAEMYERATSAALWLESHNYSSDIDVVVSNYPHTIHARVCVSADRNGIWEIAVQGVGEHEVENLSMDKESFEALIAVVCAAWGGQV